jgi:hypothetical protein
LNRVHHPGLADDHSHKLLRVPVTSVVAEVEVQAQLVAVGSTMRPFLNTIQPERLLHGHSQDRVPVTSVVAEVEVQAQLVAVGSTTRPCLNTIQPEGLLQGHSHKLLHHLVTGTREAVQ